VLPLARDAPTEPTASSVNFSAARAFSVSSRPRPGHARAAHVRVHAIGGRDPGLDVGRQHRRQRDRHHQRLGRQAAAADQLVERDALGAQVVLGRDLVGHRLVERACASRVSVMVAVPTSKLRLAEASCSVMAALLARTVASVSCEASTSK
jgi:hypothetical protein